MNVAPPPPQRGRVFSVCRKCGHDDVSVSWRRAAMYVTGCLYGVGDITHPEGEHFDVRCRTCDYTWPEALDA